MATVKESNFSQFDVNNQPTPNVCDSFSSKHCIVLQTKAEDPSEDHKINQERVTNTWVCIKQHLICSALYLQQLFGLVRRDKNIAAKHIHPFIH